MERKDWMSEALGPSYRKKPSILPIIIIAIFAIIIGFYLVRKQHSNSLPMTHSSTNAMTKRLVDTTHNETSPSRGVHQPARTTNTIPNQPSHLIQNRSNALSTAERVFYEKHNVALPTRQYNSSFPTTSKAWNKEKAIVEEKLRAESDLQRRIAQEESRKAALARQKAIAESRERAEQELLRKLAQEGPKQTTEDVKVKYLQQDRLATEINTRSGEKPSTSSVYKIGPKRKLGSSGRRYSTP